MNRECNKCIHHIGGACSTWKCEMETLEEHDAKVRAAALDHCEKCETDQWDALYKAEIKGRAAAIEEIMQYMRLHRKYAEHKNDDFVLYHHMYEWLEEIKEQKNGRKL